MPEMTHDPLQSARTAPPALAELLGRYLQWQAAAHTDGLGLPEPSAEVIPYDAAPAQPVDPRTAWEESQAALRCFQVEVAPCPGGPPPDWPGLVGAQEPVMALAFCATNFPQMVRDLHPLWRAAELKSLCPCPTAPAVVPAVGDWATAALRERRYPQALVGLGVLRLARQFDTAETLLRQHQPEVPAGWRAAWANEQAALLWHRGRCEEAAGSWQAQDASVPVQFNRGMAALFLGKPADAQAALGQAVAQLREDGAWHHLGRLYLALAEMRV
jgi:hypothetical protein